MNTKRQTLGLAAVLSATVLTGGAAIVGLVHRPASAAPAAAVVVQQAPPQAPAWSEGGDN
jgi:hypothetical protein